MMLASLWSTLSAHMTKAGSAMTTRLGTPGSWREKDVYVPRGAAEAELTSFLAGRPGVTVVTGPHCAGKSYMVSKVLAEHRKNVIRVMVCGNSIHEELKRCLGWRWEERLRGRAEHDWRAGVPDTERPVIRVELERGASLEQMRCTRECLDHVCRKHPYAYGIIVNGDEHATEDFIDDRFGCKVIWVDYFNEEEMNRFFDEHGVLPVRGPVTDASRDLRRRIFRQVGANPQGLLNLVYDTRRALRDLDDDDGDGSSEKIIAAAVEAETNLVDAYVARRKERAEEHVSMLLKSFQSKRREVSQERPHVVGFRERNSFFNGDVAKKADELLRQEQSRSHNQGHKLMVQLVDEVLSGKQQVQDVVAEHDRRDLLYWQDHGDEALTWNYRDKKFQFYTKAHENAARDYVRGK